MSTVFFRQGDRGPAVAEIRARLARLGMLAGSRNVRGEAPLRKLMYPAGVPQQTVEPSLWETTALVSAVFDEDVEEAVRRFQRDRGITVDGIVGPETFRRLEEARWHLGDRVLSYQPGHPFVGEDVLELQRQLNRMGFDSGKEDSHFGPLTDRALRDFQRNTGNSVDGVAGPETLRALGRLHRTVGAGSAHTARESYALPRLQTGIAGKSIVIDATPGSTDGAGAFSGAEATRITGSIARLTAEHLLDLGARVTRTLSRDSAGRTLDELERARACNENKGDLVVSIQIDYADPVAPLLAVYYYGRSREVFSAAGRAAATELCHELAEDAGSECVSDPRTWDILRATRMPSVRVCLGRPDVPEVRARLVDAEYQQRVARALAVGVERFFAPPER